MQHIMIAFNEDYVRSLYLVQFSNDQRWFRTSNASLLTSLHVLICPQWKSLKAEKQHLPYSIVITLSDKYFNWKVHAFNDLQTEQERLSFLHRSFVNMSSV